MNVAILNVGEGDTKLSFDPSNPAERIRAARIVKDMIRRGYALLVEVKKDKSGRPVYQRAHDFDEKRCEYIIADFDPVTAEAADRKEREDGKGESVEAPAAQAPGKPAGGGNGRRRGRPRGVRVDAGKASAVAVGRSAGG